jgi:hypothetical protein
MDWLGIALGVIAIICVILPPRYDPAIRWKERQEGWGVDRSRLPPVPRSVSDVGAADDD